MSHHITITPFKITSGSCPINAIADRIREARLAAGLNQSELARRIGVTPQAVQAWEKGGGIKVESLLAVAHALGVSPSALLYGEVAADSTDSVSQILERMATLEARINSLLAGRKPDKK